MSRVIKPRRTDFELPEDHRPYTDKYFLRSREILARDGLNPRVKYRVFLHRGSGIVCGLDEAIAIIRKYAPKPEEIEVFALYDGMHYEAKETIMTIEGPVQDLVELETMFLGVISTGTSIASQMDEVCTAAIGKDVFYFGARHWRFDSMHEVGYAAWVGGSKGSSTDMGAIAFGGKGMGTIPHALVLVYDDTVKATKKFSEVFGGKTKVIALIDTFNKEVTDSVRAAEALGKKLYGVRVDTCWENRGEGTEQLGTGVTVELARKVRAGLDAKGFEDVKIFLSSGFNAEKTREFVAAEEKHGEFFDSIGTGSVFNFRFATADIVELDGKPCHKTGRTFKPSDRLERVEL